jgi:hypothetical protein
VLYRSCVIVFGALTPSLVEDHVVERTTKSPPSGFEARSVRTLVGIANA